MGGGGLARAAAAEGGGSGWRRPGTGAFKESTFPKSKLRKAPRPRELLCWGYWPRRENHRMPLPGLWGRAQEGLGRALG